MTTMVMTCVIDCEGSGNSCIMASHDSFFFFVVMMEIIEKQFVAKAWIRTDLALILC